MIIIYITFIYIHTYISHVYIQFHFMLAKKPPVGPPTPPTETLFRLFSGQRTDLLLLRLSAVES